jgi:tetratricopeptide (TPR) repeat protein
MRICAAVLLLLGLLLTAVCLGAADREIVGEGRDFDLSYALIFKNGHGATVSVTMHLPVPLDVSPCQDVLAISFSPQPSQSTRSGAAVFEYPRVEPGGTQSSTVSLKLRKARHLFLIDARQATMSQQPPEEIRVFAMPAADFPSNDPAARKAAQIVVGHETNAYYRAVKLYDYVRSFTFRLNRAPRRTLDALSDKTVQCSDAAAVLVTLCRSLGLPARYCAGVFMKPDQTTTDETHAWCEVYIRPFGWLPFDPTMGRFDEMTRATRMAELQSEYVLLWRDFPEGFKTAAKDQRGVRPERTGLRIAFQYKPLSPARGRSYGNEFPIFALPKEVPEASKALYLPRAGNAGEYLMRGVEFLRAKDYASAERSFRWALGADPNLWIAHRQLAEAALQGGRIAEIRKEYEGKPDGALSRYILGCLAAGEKEYSTAEMHLERSVAKGGDNFLVHHALGDLFLKTKQLKRAYDHMKRALVLNPLSASTLSNLADFYVILEDWSAVTSTCEKAWNLTGRAEYLADAAQAWMRLGNYAKGAECLRRAIAAEPDTGLYHALLGECLLRLGDHSRAASELSLGLKAGLNPQEREYFSKLLKEATGGPRK